jgi:dienelactone hydrolase
LRRGASQLRQDPGALPVYRLSTADIGVRVILFCVFLARCPVPTTSFPSGKHTVPVKIVAPSTPARGAAIVVVHGSDGLVDNEHGPWAMMMRGYATALASRGFTALIPDYFTVTGTKLGTVDLQTILTHRAVWQTAIADAASHARTLAGVDPSRIGLLGFSLGGHLCARARATAKGLVLFFAPILDGIGPSSTPTLRAQIHHGQADRLVEFEANAPLISEALRKGGASSTVFAYPGAGHGFTGADPSNTKARTDSQESTVRFFDSLL